MTSSVAFSGAGSDGAGDGADRDGGARACVPSGSQAAGAGFGAGRVRADAILQGVGACCYRWDLGDDTIDWSEGAAGLLGVERDLIRSGRRWASLMRADSADSRSAAVEGGGVPDEGEGVAYRVQYALDAARTLSGRDVWLEDVGRWHAGPDGRAATASGVVRIVTERRHSEEAAGAAARLDPLTGLFNRTHLDTMLQQAIEDGRPVGFLLIGLQHFDIINSVYGYEAGDAVIAHVAQRVRANLRDIDIVARFSGAKIGVILPGAEGHEIAGAAHRVLRVMREHLVDTPRGPVATSVSIGTVSLPRHARSVSECYTNVNEALAEARRAREVSLVAFRPDPVRALARREAARTADRIVTALRDGDIHLAYQPVVSSGTHEIAFHEALIRLGRDETMEAHAFVGTACDLGLVRLVDHHALGKVLETLRTRTDATISINVSAETACDSEWISRLAGAIHERPDIAPRLIVEVTESHAVESLSEAARFLGDVHELGCRVALDDFGAGFTSFRNLKALPFDIIKIDGQFVENLAGNETNAAFIRSLVGLARLFDAQTVVEWVEDAGTARMLADWGVDYLQGFNFGRPGQL